MGSADLTEQDWARVLHAARMMVELPQWAFDSALDEYVQRACREAFGMNVRKLVEFLVDKPGTPGAADRRLTAQDFLPEWRRPTGDWAARRHLAWAARVVAHVAYTDEIVTSATREEFVAAAGDVTTELERFAVDLEVAGHPAARYFTEQIQMHVQARLP